jgi:hypothetical protein
LGDFLEFKDNMVAHKNMKSAPTKSASSSKMAGSGGSSGGLDLSISGTKATKGSASKGGFDLSISGKKV